MTEKEWLVNDLEDILLFTERIKIRYSDMKQDEHYQRIVQAIEVLEKEHDILYQQIR
ncbi:hypothetical protein ACIQZG_08320 [Lysinibacillus sp. NPDC096418]|uniref:hypothetical protein n=1 Tax=Lysinibacillus sp. NPDC096418 TaxID=3364138 RepID=UPI00381C191D